MAYITNSNLRKITHDFNLSHSDISRQLYLIPIYFFSKYETNELLAIQELLENPEKYFNKYYTAYKAVDTYKYVKKEEQPSYHKMQNCPRLSSDFKGIEIYGPIQNEGVEEIDEFRKWFKEDVGYIYEKEDFKKSDFEKLKMRVISKYGNRVQLLYKEQLNSDYEEYDNIKIEDLITKINIKIKEVGRFYYITPKNTAILKKFSKCTFLAYRSDPIDDNDTGYTENEVRELLCHYDDKFKRPLKDMLIKYYKLKHGHEIELSGLILERLGFKSCRYCHDEHNHEDLVKKMNCKNNAEIYESYLAAGMPKSMIEMLLNK